MSDDNEPQGPSNPFIKFKNHVNARIGTGVSVFTGTTDDHDKPQSDTKPSTLDRRDRADHHVPTHTATSWPWPDRNQSPGSCRRAQSSVINFWDDWCRVDPYSPHNLQHLPQPTPKDLPSGADSADFGYPEAFEDLMTASSPFGGHGHLMDLAQRAALKRSADGKLVHPETPCAWVRRLYGDALLPPPFLWEQPGLAGGILSPWVAQREQAAGGLPHTWEAFETARRAGHGNDDIDNVARAYLEMMRHIEGGVESFSKFEEMVGRDLAGMMQRGREVAEKTLEVFSGQRSENHNADSSSDSETHGGPKPAPTSEENQPNTEEDLFEMIESVSAEAGKFLSNFGFGKITPGQAPTPAERPARDSPPVKETVEYDRFGGKTIRTCTEHVDMFGFIHSKTEVRRLNEKGETVGYDTRYSVRSSDSDSRRDHAHQEEYKPRHDAPVSVSTTPDQHSAVMGIFSDEQLEAFRTAGADEASLDPETLALKNHQMQLVLLEQQRRARLRNENAIAEEARRASSGGAARGVVNHAFQDYQMQLMLLEEQNKRRFRAARAAAEADDATSADHAAPGGGEQRLRDYQLDLMRLEEENKETLRRAKDEQEAARPVSDKPQRGTKPESWSGWFWK